jgi:hypothetical protein
MDGIVEAGHLKRRFTVVVSHQINSSLDWLGGGVFIPLVFHKIVMTRKTPLRSKTPLKRSKGLKRGGRLRNASPKRQREYKEYAKVKKAYLALHPVCEKCKKAKSQDIHHKAGRVGQWLCRYEYFAAVCRGCHDAIHENGVLARKQGWIIDTIHAPPNPEAPPQGQAHTPKE